MHASQYPHPSTDVDLSAKVASLRHPDTYPEQPSRIEAVETHLSWVFLTDRYAYKLKKPIRYEGRDFTTLEARRANALEEVRLNRRLAHDVYLGVVPLVRIDTRLRLEVTGEPVDWLVKMRRLPANRMLDVMIRERTVREDDVRHAAEILAHFYAASEPIPIEPDAYRQRFEQDIERNARTLLAHGALLQPDAIESASSAQLRLLRRKPSLFDERVTTNHIIEGHGDLRPEHVCLEDTPVIFDCLEFDRNLRILDPLDELGFLTLECERIGNPVITPIIFDTYRAITCDHEVPRLVSFYKSYRALLWARLAIARTDEVDRAAWGKWIARANAYLRLATQYAASLG